MRFGHVRVAAVTLLSGGFLTLGLLDTAYAAPQATVTKTVCQALPSSASPKPSPSPSPKPSPSPSPSPSPTPSPSTSSSSSSSSTAAAPATNATGVTAGPNQSASTSPAQSGQTGSPSATSASSSATSASTSATSASTSGGTASTTLDAFVAASPSGGTSTGASGSTSSSAGASTSSAAPTQLCVSVQSSQSSIKRGQTATYTVQVSTKGGPASNVSVALAAQPSTQKPEFTSGCTKGDGTASCTVSSVTATAPAALKAQIAVASNATSVSSLKLTATASVATTAKWTPPSATGTTSVTGASSAKALPGATHLTTLPLGPIPNLNVEASLLIGAGNAAGLFPAITPSPIASPGQVVRPQSGRQDAAPLSGASTVSFGAPVFTAQVVGLIALGLAIMLTVTRLSLRKRSGSRRAGS
jgi:hypothetical protein